jgi:hypothetical protein
MECGQCSITGAILRAGKYLRHEIYTRRRKGHAPVVVLANGTEGDEAFFR